MTTIFREKAAHREGRLACVERWDCRGERPRARIRVLRFHWSLACRMAEGTSAGLIEYP